MDRNAKIAELDKQMDLLVQMATEDPSKFTSCMEKYREVRAQRDALAAENN